MREAEPCRRRRLTLLPEDVDGHDPVARGPLARRMAKGGLPYGLGSDADDVPRALELVDVVADHAFLRAPVPLELRDLAHLAAEDVQWLRWDGERVRRRAALGSQPVHGADHVRVDRVLVVGRFRPLLAE